MSENGRGLLCLLIVLSGSPFVPAAPKESWQLQSPDGLNMIAVSLNDEGQPFFRIQRRGRTLIADSPLGVRCEDQDFAGALTLHEASKDEPSRQRYTLMAGNTLNIDQLLIRKRLTFKNKQGELVILELAASNEGAAFRYRFQDDDRPPRVVTEECTGFQLPPAATGWLQPYHAAGPYTPAYEDFYFRVTPGDPPPVSRGNPRGWCLPVLFHLPSEEAWLLIAESGADGGYCGCHLATEASSKALYTIAFAYEDEVTSANIFNPDARPAPVRARQTPWRLVILGDKAGDILSSTLITDLADPSRICDTSWIKPGRASWAWWSHPDGPNTAALFNRFTDLAADFGWEYTLFDAGWWTPGLGSITRHAKDKGVMPLVWIHAKDFYDPEKRRRKLDELADSGVHGIKVDFWCSDRQEAMAAILATLKEAAERRLVVNLHGCTIPRGWHRTWPNLLTAEAVLGTESYFFDGRYPEKAAELNTILPFTRNVSAPMDTTPVAITMRKYPRKTTAAHELATALTATSGLIHYADSVEVFDAFPEAVQRVLRLAPAAWDETRCLIGDPGRLVVLARRTGTEWFIAGLNGADEPMPVALELDSLGRVTEIIQITEGADPLMHFSVKKSDAVSTWRHSVPPFGGFVLHLAVSP
jgi:hypothetical protein